MMTAEQDKIPLDLQMILKDLNSLNSSLEKDHGKINEQLFVRDFLPLLTATEDVDMRPWLAIAGHANRAVDVVRVEKGVERVLYTVPPLFNHRGATATIYDPRLSVYQKVTESIQKARNFPGREAEIFQRAMEEAEIGDITRDESDFVMWNQVLVANGLPPIVIPELEKQLGKPADEQSTDDGIEGWDEL